MKKLVSLVLAGGMLLGLAGCSGGGESELAGLALLGGGQNVTEQSAPAKYMEFMYNDEQGKKLNDIAQSGLDRLSPEVQQKIAINQNNALLTGAQQGIQNPSSVNWWERYDVNADELTAYVNSPFGQSTIESLISSSSGGPASIIRNSFTMPDKRNFIVFEAINMAINIANASYTSQMLPRMWNMIANQFLYTNLLIGQLAESIAKGFEETNYHIAELSTWLKEKDLRDAKIALSSKIKEFASLEDVENSYRMELIKEFFTNGYEEMTGLAFESAIERTSQLNARTGVKKVPGIMLISDVVFIKQLSDMRIGYSSSFYHGISLMKYRANVAKYDLERLKQIKAALVKDFPSTPTNEHIDILAVLVSWEITLRAHIAVVYGYDIEDVDLVDPKNVGLATGTFGDYCGIDNASEWGETLINAAAMPLASLFNDGDDLTSIFDMGKSGDLAGGKSIRIVAGGKNVAYDLGLIPVYKKGLTKDSESPDGTHCYIDPATGRFVLPRPIYWSKMESAASITKPEIRHPDYTPTMGFLRTPHMSYPAAKFGNGMVQGPAAIEADYSTTIYPFGESANLAQSKGTISVWEMVELSSSGGNRAAITFYINKESSHYVKASCEGSACNIAIVVNGVAVDSFSANIRNMHHYYIIWDSNGGLSGGETVRVFMDGASILSTNASITGGTIGLSLLGHIAFGGKSHITSDNLKVWNHVVTENPSFEYNGGAGNEVSLHNIYGVAANFAPVLTGTGNGVGYYNLK